MICVKRWLPEPTMQVLLDPGDSYEVVLISSVVISAPIHGFMLQLSAILIKLQWYSSGQMYVKHILGASCHVSR